MAAPGAARSLPQLTTKAPRGSRFRRPESRLALGALLTFTLYLGGELVFAGALTRASDVVSSIFVLAVCIAPVAGLAGLVPAAAGALRWVVCGLLVLCVAIGIGLDFHALHIAPPDAQNAIAVVVVAFGQMMAFFLAGAVVLLARFIGRSKDRMP